MLSVIKANGQKEPFNEEKVVNSIKRARIPESLQPEVLAHVKSKAYDGITTSEIYHHIVEFLGQSSHPYIKSSYSLKGSIDRKSTRLNSSHQIISYAVFCLKKKK